MCTRLPSLMCHLVTFLMSLICSNSSVLLRSQLISNLYQRLVGRRDLINLKTSATTALPTVRAN